MSETRPPVWAWTQITRRPGGYDTLPIVFGEGEMHGDLLPQPPYLRVHDDDVAAKMLGHQWFELVDH